MPRPGDFPAIAFEPMALWPVILQKVLTPLAAGPALSLHPIGLMPNPEINFAVATIFSVCALKRRQIAIDLR